ncbi:hypothetical protein B0J12DRAFT_310188 [Macrophomina phaseolina]|uniref:Uncharacterized protein n=1 Tax=Macrophomina phaseolina TaxID=35725 RepID=A0ABQ8FXM6_9PEZI|nr:hypothetical protein B0J12DRAFT_310188 [Macrophomina phaseolina]
MMRGDIRTAEAAGSRDEALLSVQTASSAQTATWVSAYMEESVGEQSPDFDHQRQAFVTKEEALALAEEEREIWAEAAEEAQNLVVVVETTQRIIKKKVPELSVIDPRNVKWSEVERAIRQGLVYYQEESLKGPKGWLRKGFRKLSDNSRVFEKWIGFLPEGTYTSPVCACFKIVLGVATSIREVRDQVFDALADIPEIFMSIEQYLQIYPSKQLRARGASLYASLARTLQSIMKFFTENPLRRVGRALALEDCDASFKNNLIHMKACKAAFQEAGTFCLHNRVANIQIQMSQMQRTFMTTWERERNRADQANRNIDEMANVNLCNALLATLREDRSCFHEEMRSFMREEEQRLLLSSRSMAGLNYKKIISFLSEFGFDQRATDQEMERVMLDQATRSEASIERLTWIKETRAFQDWIMSETSRYLVIQCDDRDPQPTSTLSTLGAEIIHVLAASKVAVTAIHFCGLHNRPQDEDYTGGTGMMLNLLGQVLRSWNISWDDPYIEKSLKLDLKSGKLKAASEALRSAIQSLKSGQLVFMVLDSIDAFEHPALAAKAVRSVRSLLNIMEETGKNGGVVMKILVTAPNQRSLVSVVEEYGNGETLVVPDITDCGLSSLDRSGILELAVSQIAEK